jgi:hypothetical protein
MSVVTDLRSTGWRSPLRRFARTAAAAEPRPDRCRELVDLELDEGAWESLRIPVATAFFFQSTPAEKVVAFYPSPMGATESLLELGAWERVVVYNPVLATMEPDVEALLVHRARGAREHWLVPVDACYGLVGVIRTHWKGLAGGQEVWPEIAAFFDALRRRARRVDRYGRALDPRREEPWQWQRRRT